MATLGAHGKVADSWWGASTPVTTPAGTTNTYVGVELEFDVPGRVMGFRVWRPTGHVSGGFVLFFTATHELLVAKQLFDDVQPAAGWKQCWIRPTYRISTTESYCVAWYCAGGGWKRTNTIITSDVVHNNIRFKRSFQSTSIDVVNVVRTTNTNANGVDVLFQPD